VIGDGLNDRLADPPYRVGDEFHVALGIEAARRFHQSHVPFVNQIQEGKAETPIALGVADHESKIALDQPLHRVLIARSDAAAELFLLLGGQEGEVPDLSNVTVQGPAFIGRRTAAPG
jgi:hypothetical protein